MTKRVIFSIVGSLIGVLGFFAIKYALTPVFDNIKLNKDLKEAAETENSKCPNIVADGLVMDRVIFVKEEKKIIYEGRFTDFSISDFDIDDFKTSVTYNLIEGLAAGMGPGGVFNGIKNKNVIFEYVYKDYEYVDIARIRILLNEPVTAID